MATQDDTIAPAIHNPSPVSKDGVGVGGGKDRQSKKKGWIEIGMTNGGKVEAQ